MPTVEWISGRLPKHRINLLVVIAGKIGIGWFNPPDGTWRNLKGAITKKPSHWAYLPILPESEPDPFRDFLDDAERYRFLRQDPTFAGSLRGDDLDAAIDDKLKPHTIDIEVTD